MGLYENSNGNLNLLAGGTLYASAPIGAILPFGGSSAPQGFLICDGTAVSRTTYSALFAVIGTSFGAGDGSTTFNVPDLREAVPVGTGTRESGVATHDTYDVGQFKDDQVQSHTHSITSNVSARTLANRSPVPNQAGWTFFWGADNTNDNTGRTGETTHGKQLGVNYIIKATTIALPSDFEDAVDEKIKEVTTPNLTALTAVTKNIANSQTYLNQNIFTIPADARRVFFSMAGSGNIGGYVELIKGIQGYARDFNNISEALVTWTNNNVVNVSYVFNHTGAAKDITFQCRYLA